MKALANIQMGGGFSPLIADEGDSTPSGQVFLANEARFTSRNFSEPLTNYALGWREQNNIEATLDFIFPPVPVGRRFEFKKALNSEAFLSESDDQRAIGGDFKFVEYTGTSALGKTINKGLGIKLDYDEFGDDLEPYAQVYTANLLNRILRNELRRAVTTALAAAHNVAKTWHGTAGEDADMDVMDSLVLTRQSCGVRANRILFGDGAYTARLRSLRGQNTPAGYTGANMSMQELAGWYQVDEARVSRELYQSSATAKTDVMGNLALLFFAQSGVTKDDPSCFKRFFSNCRSGGKYAVYRRDYDKFLTIAVEHYSNCIATVSTGVGVEKLTITP